MAVYVAAEGRAALPKGREAAQLARELRGRLLSAGRGLLTATRLRQRELSVVLTDDDAIREHNRQWRDEDKATDVLAFPMDELDPDDPKRPKRGPLGDIVISVETATVEANTCGMPPADMMVFLLIHGFCHLLGHDHGEPDEAARMRAAEDDLLLRVAPDLTRPPTPY